MTIAGPVRSYLEAEHAGDYHFPRGRYDVV